MMYKTKELLAMGETEYSIRKKVKNHSLFVVARGMYSDDEEVYYETDACLAKRYPNAIFTGAYAFHYYHLTSFFMDYCDLATPQHSFPIKRKDVKQSYQDPSILNIGVVEVQTDDGPIKIYNRERLLIELIRLKEKYPPELYYEVLRNFRKIEWELDFYLINKYARRFKNGDRLIHKIKELV